MSWREIPPTAGLPINFTDCLCGVSGDSEAFDRELAGLLGVPEIDVLSSGTLSLAIAFESVKKISGRRKIIVPAYTCPLLAIAARQADVDLVLCDVASNGFRMDIHKLEAVSDDQVAAIVPTYLAGLAYDISEEKRIARAIGAFVIEDAAQALGAKRNGKALSCDGDMSIFSFAIGKGLSLYDGGLLCVRDAELRQQVRRVIAERVPKRAGLELLRCVQFLGLAALYNPSGLELVYGAPLRKALSEGDLLEAVGEHFEMEIPSYAFGNFRKKAGASLLKRLPEFVSDNRKRALARISMFSQIAGLEVLREEPDCEGAWPFIMLLAENQQQRDQIMDKLWASGLGVTRLFLSALPDYEYLRKFVPDAAVPAARDFASRSFSITNSHWLSGSDFDRILSTLEALRSSTSPRAL